MSEKKHVLIFTVLVLSLSWTYEAFIIQHGGVLKFGLLGLVGLMWIPGLLSILMRLVSGVGFGDVRFVVGKAKFYGYAALIPLILALLTNLFSSFFDIRHFALIDSAKLPQAMPMIAISLGLGVVGAFGEELGWRGYLLPKMMSGRISYPYLMSGVIWAAWHLPIIAFGGYYPTANVVTVSIAYALSIVAIGFVISEIRMRSGSVLVATVFHAAHNFFFQLVVPNFLFTQQGTRFDMWEIVGGDCGFTVAALYGLFFVLFGRRK